MPLWLSQSQHEHSHWLSMVGCNMRQSSTPCTEHRRIKQDSEIHLVKTLFFYQSTDYPTVRVYKRSGKHSYLPCLDVNMFVFTCRSVCAQRVPEVRATKTFPMLCHFWWLLPCRRIFSANDAWSVWQRSYRTRIRKSVWTHACKLSNNQPTNLNRWAIFEHIWTMWFEPPTHHFLACCVIQSCKGQRDYNPRGEPRKHGHMFSNIDCTYSWSHKC